MTLSSYLFSVRFFDNLMVNNSFTVTCEEHSESLSLVFAGITQGVANRDALYCHSCKLK